MSVCYEPCGNCPFRTDKRAFLTKGRAREITRLLATDGSFYCHKTVDYETEDGQVTDDSRVCAGFAILAEKSGKPTQIMRIAERIGLYDHTRLNMAAPVHKSAAAFIKAQRR